ncbi:flagellar hook-length control protein FliK [Virgibacillus sp. JSM 102003]|uniref:flagellar hook-length control protein FliK n=1 Tax=Virgibacillus sp. JSM 102003 TaxID=1562108 RepID=UPI0035C02A40
MNAIGTNFQQVMQTRDIVEQNSGKRPSNKESVFQDLLAGTTQKNRSQLRNQEDEQNDLSLVKMLMGTKDVQKLINSAVSKDEATLIIEQAFDKISSGKNGPLSKDEAMQILEDTISSIEMVGEGGTLKAQVMQMLEGAVEKLTSLLNGKTEVKAASLFAFIDQSPILSDKNLQKQFEALFAKAEKLLSQVTDLKSASKASPALLKVLEQWTALEKKQNTSQTMILQDLPKSSSKEQAVWKELLQSFQKRNQLASKSQYNSDAKVTSNDVTKWLQHTVGSQTNSDKVSGQQSTSLTSSVPLSKVEQYVIHMNQNQDAKPVDKQLMEQFQRVMKTSKFLTMQNGTSQLNITLRPENLGDMMVKLTQMNGEMTVKIMVSSQAAKEMLESNMYQLKNMFSPQQVVVEKQEVSSQQAQTNLSEQEEEQNKGGNEQGQSDHSEQDEHQEEGDFETQFQNILMNEKV